MKLSDKKMGDKIPLEMQVKDLEKTLVTIVKAFKDLKASVKVLEEKSTKSHDEEIQELFNRQKTIEAVKSIKTFPTHFHQFSLIIDSLKRMCYKPTDGRTDPLIKIHYSKNTKKKCSFRAR